MLQFPLLPLAASVNLLEAIRNNDVVGLCCLAVLTVLSIVSLMIIFQKVTAMARARSQSRRFQALVDREGSWDSLFHASQKFRDSPIAKLLKETYVECRLENWFEHKKALSTEERLNLSKATIEGILMRTIATEECRLQRHLGLLSMTSSLAPFIGLFGTVWGVLAAFQAVGAEGSAALSSLAPGISTALMTTIFGLAAAIPALVAHNYLMAEVSKLSTEMESFSHEIENAVRRQILTGGTA